jgi:hypothetical protein
MTTATLELPISMVTSLFTDLVGRKVSGEVAPPVAGGATGATVHGVYTTDDGTPAALCVVDLELAASLGAALVMMPVGLVRECVQDATLLPGLGDNVFEVFNVASRLLNRSGTKHVRLREQVLVGGVLPEDAASLLTDCSRRTDFDLRVDGYGAGRFSILVA